MLVTLRTPVEAGQMEAVMAAVEQLGGHVDHYLPDHTLLCVCAPHVADRVETIPGVAWVVRARPPTPTHPHPWKSLTRGRCAVSTPHLFIYTFLILIILKVRIGHADRRLPCCAGRLSARV